MTNLDYVLSSSLARNNLFSLFDILASKLRGVAEWMEGWVETWEITSNSRLMSRINNAKNDIVNNKVYTQEQVEKILKW